ncbi:hypothetical protein [Sphingobium cupriresistens]|uniref:Uncharacterized protein n=2 Tax=Sphingobium cupriresistens TaxID=1132417 RepID=A0A0J7Y0I9_9SPHN|nr:hypothetical protein [Sphingobium cupriresistens]KMS57324.1 hypothetical protein V473_03640 [Sphingobium cupriresistens LL01]RYM11025.1 hypothetical protein EWH12_09980 [Sphingobium cupriresistens]
MSETPETDTPKEARAAEAAAIRRRWITLGEILAVLAVGISALTLYLNWADKKDQRAEKAAESRKASGRAAILVLNADSVKDDRIALKTTDPDQVVQSQTILFPRALGIAPVDTTGDPRIEADWFSDALKTARAKAKLPDDSVGDERLPVAITTRFVVGGDTHENIALYDIGYGVAGRWIAGHSLSLRGLSRVETLKPDSAQARVDARWARLSGK